MSVRLPVRSITQKVVYEFHDIFERDKKQSIILGSSGSIERDPGFFYRLTLQNDFLFLSLFDFSDPGNTPCKRHSLDQGCFKF